MADTSRVTVERSYFEALLRRADFHTSAARDDPSANISISRVDYDSLLKTSREHQLLKDSLYAGGITEETLNLLIAGADCAQDHRKDSGAGLTSFGNWDDDFTRVHYPSKSFQSRIPPPSSREMGWRAAAPMFNLAPGTAPYPMGYPNQQPQPRAAGFNRQASYGISVLDDAGFDDDHDHQSIAESQVFAAPNAGSSNNNNEKRTLYFNGLSDRTTYQDLLSVIKGGKLLSIVLRERSATVFFLEGAAEFLSWAKKNDIYLHTKRIEVKWATHQFTLNTHIATKIAAGATRNLIIRHAVSKHLTEARIRDDMEHIHNLIIISVSFREGDAYVSTNSVHNALFARTCMMSRKEYRGCAIEFFADECDVPVPAVVKTGIVRRRTEVGGVEKKGKMDVANVANRFGLLEMDGDSDEENRTPEEESEEQNDDDETEGGGAAVSLSFLEE